MERSNPPTNIVHEVTYASSTQRRQVQSLKMTTERQRRLTHSPGTFTPTRKDSGLGRSRGISNPNPTPAVISHRMSVDCISMFAKDLVILEREKKVPSTPHRPMGSEPSLMPPGTPMAATATVPAEDNKSLRIPSSKGSADLSKSTTGESPLQLERIPSFESSLWMAGGTKLHPEINYPQTPLQKSKSPNLLQSWGVEIELPPASKVEGPLSKICNSRPSTTLPAAYNDFLYALFGSIRIIKGIDLERRNSPPSQILKLERPKNVLCTILLMIAFHKPKIDS